MTVYADSDFYTREFLSGRQAVISPALFPYYARKASSYIDQYTFDGIDASNVPEVVKMCCCELAEAIFRLENSPSFNGVTSERVGDISRTYESGEAKQQNLNSSIKDVIRAWLLSTGLLYRGGAYA